MKKISEIVFEVVADVFEDREISFEVIELETRLFGGSHGVLDSLGIVLLVTDIEERISDIFDIEIVLADDRAMSRKTSPFRDVGMLITYVESLISESKEESSCL